MYWPKSVPPHFVFIRVVEHDHLRYKLTKGELNAWMIDRFEGHWQIPKIQWLNDSCEKYLRTGYAPLNFAAWRVGAPEQPVPLMPIFIKIGSGVASVEAMAEPRSTSKAAKRTTKQDVVREAFAAIYGNRDPHSIPTGARNEAILKWMKENQRGTVDAKTIARAFKDVK